MASQEFNVDIYRQANMPREPFAYTLFQKRGTIAAPQFVRARHRFRGPRESEKFNLEMAQMRFDLTNLFWKSTYNEARFFEQTDVLENGGTITAIFSSELGTSTTTVESISTLALRINRLEKRIKALENG